MPKLKVHQGTAKRIRLTKTNKMLHRRPFGNHFLGKKTSSRKRGYKVFHQLSGASKRNLKRSLGK